MFATLLGGLPWPVVERDAAIETAIEVAIRAQADAGLEPVTDGRLRDPSFDAFAGAVAGGASELPSTVDAWRFASGLTDRAVKQALPGPYSLARRLGVGLVRAGSDVRARRTHAIAEALAVEALALAAAGCTLIEIEETEAHHIGDDEAERRLFRQAHRRLTDAVTGTHLSLSIVGGSAAGAGIETILDAPYASLAVDLINGPDNWNLVTRAASERGIVAGALGARETGDEPKEILLWAAHYAASSGARGIARVGLGSAGSYANLTWAAAVRKMNLLGTAARLAALPPGDELAASLDPKAVSARRAGLGRKARRAPKEPPR